MVNSLIPPGLEEWKSLGPFHLPTFRGTRYQGENERRILQNFAETDQKLLRLIYGQLLELFLELRPIYHDQAASLGILERFVAEQHDVDLIGQVRELGRETLAHPRGVDCARTIHDLRGGAFQAFALRMDLLRSFPEVLASIHNVFFLLRDHLKIMRNCIADLDPERFSKDAAKRDHAASNLVEKWSKAEFSVVKKPVRVVLNCYFEGTLCESCLEFSTLDRIIYNLMNNAARFTTDGLVHFAVLPMPTENPENIRFVVANAVSPQHRALLLKTFPGDLTDLFQGGFSTGGHGLGSRICADFCAQAYGISDFSEAKDAGHFGAKFIDQFFVTWFHWPIVGH